MGIIDRVRNLAKGSDELEPRSDDLSIIDSPPDQPITDFPAANEFESPLNKPLNTGSNVYYEPTTFEIETNKRKEFKKPVGERVKYTGSGIEFIEGGGGKDDDPSLIQEISVGDGGETPSDKKRIKSTINDDELTEFNPDGTVKQKYKPEEPKKIEETLKTEIFEKEHLEYPKDDASGKSTEKTWTQQQASDIKEKLKEKFAVKNVFKTGGNVIFGSPVDEVEYARKGGYIGEQKGTLQQKNATLEENNEELQKNIDGLKERIKNLTQRRDELERKNNKTPEELVELRNIRIDINDAIKERDKHQERLDKNKELIGKNNANINAYDEAVSRGKRVSSTRSVVGKKLSAIGQNTKEEVLSGMYEGKMNKDWFDPTKGFLAKPYMKSTSPIEPVRSKSANLNAYTRMTGQSVGRSMADAVTTVRANKNIAPLGVPGTVAGAKNQFDYAIPAKRIGLGDINTANINRDILPSIYDVPKPQITQPVVEQQYKQVIQQDGTVVNVPVPIQQRKPKLVTISVNRFTHRSPNVSGKSFVNGSSKFVISGKNFGGMGSNKAIVINPVSPMVSQKSRPSYNIEGFGFSKKTVGKGSVKTLSKLNIGFDGLGPNRTIKSATFRERPEIDLGLINVKRMGMKINKSQNGNKLNSSNANIETMVEERKSKDTLPLVNINFSKKIGKKIDKILKNSNKK